jgi:hypothetical protein
MTGPWDRVLGQQVTHTVASALSVPKLAVPLSKWDSGTAGKTRLQRGYLPLPCRASFGTVFHGFGTVEVLEEKVA